MRYRARLALGLTLGLGLFGCGATEASDCDASAGPDAPAADAVAPADAFDSRDCTLLDFVEVMPEHTSAAFRDPVEDALRWLCQSDTDHDVGYLTYQSIARGLVKIDQLEDMTDLDYRTALVFEDIDPETTSRDQAMAILVTRMYGYMWSNRIYLNMAVDRSTEELASTLAHEVNHILNRSDENYYLPMDHEVSDAERIEILDSLSVDDNRAFVEEYRAFYIEEVIGGSPLDIGMTQSMRDLKSWVRSTYGFTDVDVDDYPDYPTGILVPDDDGWAARPPSLCSDQLLYFPCDQM